MRRLLARERFAMAAKSRRIRRMRRPAATARFTRPPRMPMSFSMSASERGLIGGKFRGWWGSLATVSCWYGTEPMTRVGRRRRISSTEFMCQQSPSLGRPLTGATSAHHFVTPTRVRFAPMAQRMDVTLGASETIRGEGTVDAGIVTSLAEAAQRTGLGERNGLILRVDRGWKKSGSKAAALQSYFLS